MMFSLLHHKKLIFFSILLYYTQNNYNIPVYYNILQYIPIMLSNFIVAVSNFPAVYPIYLSFANKDYLTASSICFVAAASFISHLAENHKHGMSGIGFSRRTSYILNRFDVIGCFIVAARFSYIYYAKYGFFFDIVFKNKFAFVAYCLPFALLMISECDKYNPALKKTYIVAHSTWHIAIFTVIGSFLKNFIY